MLFSYRLISVFNNRHCYGSLFFFFFSSKPSSLPRIFCLFLARDLVLLYTTALLLKLLFFNKSYYSKPMKLQCCVEVMSCPSFFMFCLENVKWMEIFIETWNKLNGWKWIIKSTTDSIALWVFLSTFSRRYSMADLNLMVLFSFHISSSFDKSPNSNGWNTVVNHDGAWNVFHRWM